MSRGAGLLGARGLLLGAAAWLLSACSAGSAPAGGAGVEGSEPQAGNGGDGICLLNTCHSDLDCGACSDGRTSCLVAENRCVGCDPNTGVGCAEGMRCSSWGICAPEDQVCPVDADNNPTIGCAQSSDCLACSPMNQVCGPQGTCVACTEQNIQSCSQADLCIANRCASKCPAACTQDGDCQFCGGPGNEARACFQHKCAQCSDTVPCAGGLQCREGTCVPGCGVPGPEAGACTADEDCGWCGDGQSASSWKCKPKALNDTRGTCTPAAAGCADIGQGFAVLPAPWDQVTQTCSSDSNCAGVGVSYNVGQLVRDLVGGDSLNLGFADVAIHDAYVSYGMNKCASVELINDISCGVCVPCKADADCHAVGIDPLVSDLFEGEPLAQIAGSILLDLLFGSDSDTALHFFCQDVAAGYGVCTPCGNPLEACGNADDGGGGGGSGTCDHAVCATGAALDPGCDACTTALCAEDPYCCTTEWDATCVSEVDQFCAQGCGGGGGGCSHDECTSGDALYSGCSDCVTAICDADPYCCNTEWDATCVGEVDALCSPGCGGGGGGGCAHDECVAGAALDAACSDCAYAVCSADSFCCSSTWDSQCVAAAQASAACPYCY
jgi:hypothetical protein